MKAMILAAGRGERMRPLTDTCPKPLLKVKDKPLIEYHIEALVKAGIAEIVINHAWLGEQIVNHIGTGQRWNIKIQYSKEEQALETAGGIHQALPWLTENNKEFIVVNGDIFTDYKFVKIINHQLNKDILAHLILVNNPTHNPSGDFAINDNDQLYQNEQAEKFTFSGIAKYHIDFFSHLGTTIKRAPLAPMLISAMDDHHVSGEIYSGFWSDVGTVERLNEVNQFNSN